MLPVAILEMLLSQTKIKYIELHYGYLQKLQNLDLISCLHAQSY